MSCTKRQLQIRVLLTLLHLTPRRCPPIIPPNTLTRLITRLDPERAACKAVAEEGAHIIPHRAVVAVVGEDDLAGVGREESAGRGSDLEGDTAGYGV